MFHNSSFFIIIIKYLTTFTKSLGEGKIKLPGTKQVKTKENQHPSSFITKVDLALIKRRLNIIFFLHSLFLLMPARSYNGYLALRVRKRQWGDGCCT